MSYVDPQGWIEQGPFTRTGAFLASDPQWVSATIDWFDQSCDSYNQGFYSITAVGSPIDLPTRIESSNDPTFPADKTDVKNASDQVSAIRRYPFGYYGLRYQRLVIGPPSSDLTEVIVDSGLVKSVSRSTPRLINENIPENSHSDWTVLAALLAQGNDGSARPLQIDQLNRLLTRTNQHVTQSSDTVVTFPRNDINLEFSRSKGAAAVASLVDGGSVGGTVTHSAALGQAVFTCPAAPGSRAFFHSLERAQYESGLTIQGGQTAVIFSGLSNLVGSARVLIGYMEPDGVGGIDYGIGWGADANGIFVWRLQGNGAPIKITYSQNFNRDKLDGGIYSQFLMDGVPVPLTTDGISILYEEFSWFGIAPPTYRIMPPPGSPITAHVEETPGQQNVPTVPDPNMPLGIFIENDPIAGGEIVVHSGCWVGGPFTGKSVIQAQDEAGIYQDIQAKSPNDNNANPGFALETLGYNLVFDPNGTPSNRWDRMRGVNGSVRTASQPLPFVWSEQNIFTATSSSQQLIAATTNRLERVINITVPSMIGGVAQIYGVCIKFGNGNATTGTTFIQPGQSVSLVTKQRIAIIREAAALLDVKVSWMIGVPAE